MEMGIAMEYICIPWLEITINSGSTSSVDVWIVMEWVTLVSSLIEFGGKGMEEALCFVL